MLLLKKKWLKIMLISILIILLGIGIYAYVIYHSTKKMVNHEIHQPIETIDTDLTKKKLTETKSLNILLLGIDERENDKGRSDAMMVMHLDPNTDEMNIVSIPRDTYTEIIGKGKQDKINHAYTFGGPDMSVATVERLLQIEIDYYVTMNMDGLIELVDELGTITLHNDVAWSDEQYDFPLGEIEMDGDQTMAYVRMRKQDPNGDFGRTTRQRKVITSIIEKGAKAGSIPKLLGFVSILGKNMTTNMDFADMKKLYSGYKSTRNHIDEYMLEGTGQKIDHIYYLIVPDEEVQVVHDMLTNNK